MRDRADTCHPGLLDHPRPTRPVPRRVGTELRAPAPPAGAVARGGVRQEIQALRAVAVMLVVVHHLWPSALPGGFVGVDVFFAISGFLITSLLLREIDRTGRLSLSHFWARRARRILPAALVTLLFCVVATILVVPPNDWEQYLADAQASTAYVQNWHLASTAVDYFAAADAPSPLQHFWSLSVEEQFYLVWPLLLLAAAAGAPAHLRRRSIAAVMAAVTVVSLAYGIVATPANPAAAYFQTPARAWEFGAGGLLTLLPNFERSPAALRCALSWAGLVAIAVAALLYSAATPFPGCAALLPVAGALAVMRAGMPARRWSPGPLLAARPVQFLGDISYAVYLWHWPLLVLAPFVLASGLNTHIRIGLLMLTVVAAWLTKVLIEDPVRTAAFLTRRKARWTFALALAGTAAMLAVTAGCTSHLEAQIRASAHRTDAFIASAPDCFGAASRDPERPCRNPRLRLEVRPTPVEARDRPNAPCKIVERDGRVQVCAFGAGAATATGTVALVGDSHASHWRAALEVVARRKGWRGLSLTHTSCPFSKATRKLDEPDRSHCLQWKKQLLRWFGKHPEVTTVFVAQLSGGSGVVANGRDPFAAAMAGYVGGWKSLPGSVKHVVVLRDTPNVGVSTDVCVTRAIARRRPAGLACALPRSRALNRDPAATAAARLHSPRVQVADLTRFMCDRGRCYPVIGGALVYKDATHLTRVFATTLGPYLDRAVDRLMTSWDRTR